MQLPASGSSNLLSPENSSSPTNSSRESSRVALSCKQIVTAERRVVRRGRGGVDWMIIEEMNAFLSFVEDKSKLKGIYVSVSLQAFCLSVYI